MKKRRRFLISGFFPIAPFVAINLFGLIIVRRENLQYYTEALQRHEKIHTIQMIETLFIGFYLWYMTEWIVRCCLALLHKRGLLWAYNSMLFEREAYGNQDYAEYLNSRKPFQYKWFKKGNVTPQKM